MPVAVNVIRVPQNFSMVCLGWLHSVRAEGATYLLAELQNTLASMRGATDICAFTASGSFHTAVHGHGEAPHWYHNIAMSASLPAHNE